MVNKERVRLLVDALRSKKFRQGYGQLARFDPRAKKVNYCCLGVACEVARSNGLELSRVQSPIGREYMYGPESERSVMPIEVQRWYGFYPHDISEYIGNNPQLSTHDGDIHRSSASIMNDSLGYSFNDIADAFERTFLADPK